MRLSLRRSFVILAVLVIVTSALLIVTSVLFIVQAETAGAAGSADAVQSRALAWSGVQAVMARLDDQREQILSGRLPRVDEQYTIDEWEGGLGVVRLLPAAADGRRLVPEAGKLDVNAADAAALEATGMVDAALAEAIVHHRDETLRRPFRCVEELLGVPGVTPELVYGPIEELASDGAADRGADGMRDAAPISRWMDVLTVFAVEPALQADGRRRINLNVRWSEELGQRVDDRFGAGSGEALKRIIDSGARFTSDSRIVQVMRELSVAPSDWPPILDAFTTDRGEHHFGRVDLNAASPEALRSLPGLDADASAQIVQLRSQLTAEQRATVAWPVILGAVSAEKFQPLAGRVTTRSWTYRVRVAAGTVDADAPEGPLENSLVLDVVIDLSSPRARVAYLRDVTLLGTAAGFAADASNGVVDEPLVLAFNDVEEDSAPPESPAPLKPMAPPDTPDPSEPSVSMAAGAAADAGNRPQRQRIGRWLPIGAAEAPAKEEEEE